MRRGHHERRESPRARHGSARAVALRPPEYGIDFVDQRASATRSKSEDEPAPAGRPLPGALRARMEGLLGVDLAPVRVHEDEAARALGAVAFTRGHDICFAPGRYQPHTPRGQRVLSHEVAHVVQQSEGRVRATGRRGGVAINDDPHLERAADRVGLQAVHGEPRERGGVRALASPSGAVAQCILYDDIVDGWIDGNKIYGLSAARADTINALKERGFKSPTIDDLNNEFIGTGVLTRVNPKTYDDHVKPRSSEAKGFRKALREHRKYDPRSVAGEEKGETRVRQACKGGVEFTTGRKKLIHFILDGLNMDWVIKKAGPWDQMGLTSGGEKARDITGAEMRWIYRHRDDPKVMPFILFWRGGQNVAPPWIEDPTAWAHYVPRG
jgi:hypothetical protein